MNGSNILAFWGPFVMSLVGFIVVFFICRDIVLWYFKINRCMETLERIERHLKVIADQTKHRS